MKVQCCINDGDWYSFETCHKIATDIGTPDIFNMSLVAEDFAEHRLNREGYDGVGFPAQVDIILRCHRYRFEVEVEAVPCLSATHIKREKKKCQQAS